MTNLLLLWDNTLHDDSLGQGSVLLVCDDHPLLSSLGHTGLKLSHYYLFGWASPAEIHVEEWLAPIAPLGDLHDLSCIRPHAQLAPGENQFTIDFNLEAVLEMGSRDVNRFMFLVLIYHHLRPQILHQLLVFPLILPILRPPVLCSLVYNLFRYELK